MSLRTEGYAQLIRTYSDDSLYHEPDDYGSDKESDGKEEDTDVHLHLCLILT